LQSPPVRTGGLFCWRKLCAEFAGSWGPSLLLKAHATKEAMAARCATCAIPASRIPLFGSDAANPILLRIAT
jgi:hypothetical protein